MESTKCPNCGEVLAGERPKFCGQCGCNVSELSQQDLGQQKKPSHFQSIEDPVTVNEKQTVYFEKLKEAWSDGKVPVSELEKLGNLREELGITNSQAEELSKKAIESLRPVQKDDFEEESKITTSRGIVLSLNMSQFYMQSYRGVIDVKIENLSDNPFNSVKMELSSDLLARSEHRSFRLEACEIVRKRFQVKPDDAGVYYIQFRISARQGNSVYAYTAEATPLVLPKVENVKDVQIQADNLINLGQASEKFNIGGVIDLHMDELIRSRKIKSAYDFMMEYKKLPPKFQMLKLTFDPDRSEQLTNSLTITKKVAKGKRIVESARGSLTDSASLQIQSKDRPVNIVLFSKLKVTLGKNRRNNIVTRICPRSVVNDNQSNQIGRNHCYLELIEKGAFIKDNHSLNGTLLDSKKVSENGKQIKTNTKELEISGVLKMSIKCLDDKYRFSNAAYKEALNGSLGSLCEMATKIALNSITLERLNNLGFVDKNGFEKYCLIYRVATIGSASHCSINLVDKGLEPLHAAITYLDQRYYLENLSDLTDVLVNDTMLSKNELIPLSFGDRIRIARLDMIFLQKAQLFIDAI
jgi:pSer/pThr/pTyr-binding forkhead associated (FHA) protein